MMEQVAHANGESSAGRQISASAFNSSYNDNAYVGYMYGQKAAGSYNATHANANDSTIKTTIDSWYKTNIQDAGYSDMVADVIYCNDRSIKSGTDFGTLITYYGAYQRLFEENSPVLTCTNKNDRFTVDDTSKGNGVLTYPVGLITADEVAMGGAVNGSSNSSYYLYTGNYYWTMSPYYFNGTYAYEFVVGSNGSFYDDVVVNTRGVRPVVSLKSDISVTGSGTQNDPFLLS